MSQWKKNDILRADAFEKPGKTGKLIKSVALEHVRTNRNIGQSLGNGLSTLTELPTDVSEPPPLPPSSVERQLLERPAQNGKPTKPLQPIESSVESKLKQVKLEQEERKNRLLAVEEAQKMGALMSTEDAKAEMETIATRLMQVFDGAIPSFAEAVAAKFGIPSRDVEHLLKAEYRRIRVRAERDARERAGGETERKPTKIDE